MHDKTSTTRLRIGVSSLVALVTVALFAIAAAPAVAGNGFPGAGGSGYDPQTTNVPYLAWRGEEVRLVKCFPVDEGFPENLGNLTGKFILEDWSGDPHMAGPVFENNAVLGVDAVVFEGEGEQAGRACFATNITSQKPGLAVVKLVVQGDPIILNQGAVPFLKHQFLVGWMTIGDVTLNDVEGGFTLPLGGFENELQVLVTGTMPMDEEFQTEAGLPATVTLPNDWAAMATALARSGNDDWDYNPCLWDIHDELSWEGPGADVHGTAGPVSCTVRAAGAERSGVIDNVDVQSPFAPVMGPDVAAVLPFWGVNPWEIGEFSNKLGSTGPPTVGPWDPLRPHETYLGDGVLDAGDAPMPPLRVDVAIAPNTGGTDIGGTGLLNSEDKHSQYTRGGVGAHSLFAPFYAACIPATACEDLKGTTSSGTTGPFQGNNFPGYLTGGRRVQNGVAQQTTPAGLYHFWDFARIIDEQVGVDTTCPTRFEVVDGVLTPIDFIQTPEGPLKVALYTDEHGEARVDFKTPNGFFANALLSPNANGACDFQGVNPIGTAVISALAQYPYQPVTARPEATSTITKTIVHQFNKQVTCVPKGTGPNEIYVWICTASGTDLFGNDIGDEIVCFSAQSTASGIMLIPGPGEATVPDPQAGLNRLCIRTGNDGMARVEFSNTLGAVVDITAHFVNESLFRNVIVNPAASGGTTTSGTTTSGTTTSGTTTGTTTTTGGVSSGAPISRGGAVKPQAAKRGTLSFARIVYAKGNRKLVVRVASAKTMKTAKIRVQLRGKRGTLATAVRTVRTNRTVTVSNLRITKAVTKVRVSVVA